MSSLELDDRAEVEPQTKAGTLVRLLDPAFGFFVFSIHFLVVYIAEAVACALGLVGTSSGARSGFLWSLALVTLACAAVAIGHSATRYRQQRHDPDQRFRIAMTIGNDAIASVAILLQLFPILLVPVCA
jgi:hypothetical protein